MSQRRLVSLFVLLGLALAYWAIYERGENGLYSFIQELSSQHERSSQLTASGTIKAREIALSSTVGGRVAAMFVNKGDQVQRGQLLLSLDRSLHESQVAVARAQVQLAQALLDQARAGVRPGEILAAEAELAQAKAAHQAAESALQDLLVLRENQQELELQLAVAEVEEKALGYRLRQAIALKDAAEVQKELLEHTQATLADWPYPFPKPNIPMELQVSPYTWWKSWSNVNAAQEALAGKQAQLAYLRDLKANPLKLDAAIASAQAIISQTTATVDAAQAKVQGLKAIPSREQLEALEAQVSQARVALEALLAQGQEMDLMAPVDAIVVGQAVRVGELLVPGATALVLADPSQLTLTVFIPEPRLGEVRVGQSVEITTDSWPARVFSGEVIHIADRAEYTPRNVATQEGRMLTYYAVQIRVYDPEGILKPGMPADAVFK